MSKSLNVTFDGTSTFNKTLLDQFHYQIYPNGTLSNNSICVLVFGIYAPSMLPNGTILNGTKCDAPINPIGIRGDLGIVSALFFAIAICLACVCLRKHGASHLPEDKSTRLNLVSRRWQWYWLLLGSAVGCVSGFTAIDVDREYIQGTAIALQSFFYCCLLPVLLAATWEMTRHWGYFQERLLTDVDPFYFSPDHTRSKIEFYIPLVFYPFAFLTFFLSNLRKWTPITRQFPGAATDGRFKASSVMALISLLIIFTSSLISQHYYRQRIPLKIILCIVFLLVKIIYNIISAWQFTISPLKYNVNNGYIYGLGYIPAVLVVFIIVASGFVEENEDLVIRNERRKRASLPDNPGGAEMGSVPMGRGGTVDTHTTMNTGEESLKNPPPYSEIDRRA